MILNYIETNREETLSRGFATDLSQIVVTRNRTQARNAGLCFSKAATGLSLESEAVYIKRQ
jgi:hypothetical protein